VRPVDRGLDTELDQPKYARLEFERRWLVDRAARPALSDAFVTLIDDLYIAGTRLRLRQMRRPDLAETKWKLTKKYECDEPCARPIVSAYLTESEYELLRTLPGDELCKRRLHFEHEGRWWSLDLFEGPLAGLEIVECEAEDRTALAELSPPDWVLREVTDLPHWQGGALAANGIPED
jgi:CYTH domain-containing protein